MFSKLEQLHRRTGKKGVGRYDYLQQLVTEFEDTNSTECKEQVLANLANFAYDPINYEFLRKLNVIDLFLDQLSEENTNFVQFALSGLCNLALDIENKEHILHCGGVRIVAACLSSRDEDTVLSAISTLMFLITPESKPEITTPEIVDCIFRLSRSRNTRLRNLATIFLEDYCTTEQVTETREIHSQSMDVANIPLPKN
ncbi:armadillo repeat-containing protein 7 isoform X1 [Periplaneta americana]|uniref:armadillo repeat-containing protein 7 isoform X1 n=1 Tax=Periplaneta americana TaxID=6978 RepID=UPI0037E960CE